jgi:hypothetical protein
MNEHRQRKGPHLGLLLLIPAAVIIAKGASRRRARWESQWGGAGGFGPRHGHHGYFGAGHSRSDDAAAAGMPPKIERMLEAWHAEAHEQGQAAEPSAS